MSRLLHDCGEALYGSRWQTELSRALEVSDRTIRRWASGADDVPPGVWMDVLRITQERGHGARQPCGPAQARGGALTTVCAVHGTGWTVTDLDIYRAAHEVLKRPDADAVLRERLAALAEDPEGHATWVRIAAAMAVLRADKPEPGQPTH